MRVLRPMFALALGMALGTHALAVPAGTEEPPTLRVPGPAAGEHLVFVVYGDTRFTKREDVANGFARRALVERIAGEHPVAILIGGDLVFQGSDPQDYEAFRTETASWAIQKVPWFPALGNHELKGCEDDKSPCLENWWNALAPLPVRPHRWYSVAIGPSVLAVVLDSNSSLRAGSNQRIWLERQLTGSDPQVKFIVVVMHYPPVRDPLVPRAKDEKEVALYLSHNAKNLPARVIVVGSHLHNYERYYRDGVVYLVSGGGGAKPAPSVRIFGEQSKLSTAVNFHYVRFVLEDGRLTGTMVRFDTSRQNAGAWTEPDRFEVKARD